MEAQHKMRYLMFKRMMVAVEVLLLLTLLVTVYIVDIKEPWRTGLVGVQILRVVAELNNHHALANMFNMPDVWMWFAFTVPLLAISI